MFPCETMLLSYCADVCACVCVCVCETVAVFFVTIVCSCLVGQLASSDRQFAIVVWWDGQAISATILSIWLVPKTYCCLTGPNPFVAQLSHFVAQQSRSVSLVVSFLKKTNGKLRF